LKNGGIFFSVSLFSLCFFVANESVIPKLVEGKTVARGTRPSVTATRLNVGLGLGQIHYATALFPLAALFEQVDALETFEDVALGCDGAGGTEAAMLGHKRLLGVKTERLAKQDRREAQGETPEENQSS
jgi:hypothetical protein